MPSKAQRITGWALTGLLGLFLIVISGVPKFIEWPGKQEMMEHMGLTPDLMKTIGVIEIAITILYLFSRTAFFGAILITAYLGGAVMTHLRVGDPWVTPVIIGIIVWVALGLRQPAVLFLAAGKSIEKQTA